MSCFHSDFNYQAELYKNSYLFQALLKITLVELLKRWHFVDRFQTVPQWMTHFQCYLLLFYELCFPPKSSRTWLAVGFLS